MAKMETVGGGTDATLKLKTVVVANGEPVTVIGYVPMGVLKEVAIVKPLKLGPGKFVGYDGLFKSDTTEAPEGNPLTVSDTASASPDSRYLVIVFDPESPALTAISPEFLNEYRKHSSLATALTGRIE